MKFYGEMRVQGGGPLDGARFDALAYALAGIEEADPAIEDVDLTSSLSQGWVTASMTITHENLELAVAKLIATVRAAIYPNGDHGGGWQFLTETAGLSVHPVTDRAGMSAADQVPAPGPAGPGQPPVPGPPPGPGPGAVPVGGPPPALGNAVPPGAPARPPLPSRLDARSRSDLPSRPDAPVSVWR
jgi:hypothetical protein